MSVKSDDAASHFLEVLKQGMLFRSSISQTDKHVKIWLAGGEIFSRELTQQAGTKDEFVQGETQSMKVSALKSLAMGDDDFFLSLVGKDTSVHILAELPGERDVIIRGFQKLTEIHTGVPVAAKEFSVALGAAPGKEPVMPAPAHNVVRLFCFNIVTHKWFDPLILTCIMINCIAMACTVPYERDKETPMDRLIITVSYHLSVIFTVEMILKLVAFLPWQESGFGYFQDNWNCFDCFIVLVGWLAAYGSEYGIPNVTILRTFRAFRALRSLGKLQGMKELISTLLLTLDPLFNVVVLTLFIFFVFSVLGMELFMGLGANRCVKPSDDSVKWSALTNGDDWEVMSDDVTFPIDGRRCGGDYQCPSGYRCYAAGRSSGKIQHSNMFNGIAGYDNLGQAFLTVFVAVTLEGWVDVMYLYQDSYNWAVSTVFHTLMVLLGAFFCLNLALAVISDTFEDQSDAAEEEEEAEKAAEKAEAEAKGLTIEEDDDDAVWGGEDDFQRPEGIRGRFFDLVIHPYFTTFITLMILVNTAALASEHVVTKEVNGVMQAQHPHQHLKRVQTRMNDICVLVFLVEMVLKLTGFGLKQYWCDPFNAFDGILVILSLIEYLPFMQKGAGFSAFRTFRLARVFKMARSWSSLRSIIESLIKTLPSIWSLTILLFLFMFIASVLGMQLMGNYIPHEERARFTSFAISMLSIFQMLTGENWNENMYSAIIYTGNYAVCLYFIVVVLIGIFIVLNLFLAILLADFECGEPPDFSRVGDRVAFCFRFLSNPSKELTAGKNECQEQGAVEGGNAIEMAATNGASSELGDFTDEQIKKSDLLGLGPEEFGRTSSYEQQDKDNGSPRASDRGSPRASSIIKKQELADKKAVGAAEVLALRNQEVAAQKAVRDAEKNKLHGTSLGVFGPENSFRHSVNRLVRNDKFEGFILLCIIASSVMLAIDGPTGSKKGAFWDTLDVLDVVFVVIFLVEAILKIIAMGWMTESDQTYTKDSWNLLDLFIVIIGLLGLLTADDGDDNSSLRTIRAFRAFRPLRTIQRAPGLKLVVLVLFQCVGVFLNICLVVLFVYFVFAIMGVQFFAGKFWGCTCDSDDIKTVDDCTGTGFSDDGGVMDCEWVNQKMNFDNVWTALLTLYEVSGLEMWLDVMYAAMDAGKDIGDQPKQEQNPWAATYFIFFILIGVFLVLNLFVGAVIDKFNDLKSENDGVNPLLTPEQKEYTESMASMIRIRPFRKPLPPDASKRGPIYNFRKKCYDITMYDTTGRNLGTTFEMFVSALIFGNIFIMGLVYWRRLPEDRIYRSPSEDLTDFQDTPYGSIIERLNDAFTWIFFAEMCLKLSAWGFKQYVLDPWNVMDGMLVGASVTGFLIEVILRSTLPLNPALFRILRLTRLSRALRSIRIVSRIGGISKLLDTLTMAIPAMANVASLLFLVIFIFTVLGMNFFGDVSIHKEHVNGMYNAHCNFRTFGSGFMLLFRSSTGEAWNGVMHDIMLYYPAAWLYFTIYMIFVSALLFELLTAIVLDQFNALDDAEENPVPPGLIANFADCWAHIDPNATKLIPLHKLLPLLMAMDPPLFESKKHAVLAVQKMELATVGQAPELKIHYVDTLISLVKFLYVRKYADGDPQIAADLNTTMVEASQLTVNIVNAYPDLKGMMDVEKAPVSTFQEQFAATRLQNLLKGRNARKSVEELRKSHGGGADSTADRLANKDAIDVEKSRLNEKPKKEKQKATAL